MEVFLNSPPPPPPPVPALEETPASEDGVGLSIRERMELHRANPTCNSCHQFIDPIGLALENFDATGQWRTRERSAPLDTRGQLWDGTLLESPADLREALLGYSEVLLRTFTRNLMAYAIGRRVEHFDNSTIREIVRSGEEDGHRMSKYILGVIGSPAFQMRTLESVADDSE